MKFQDTQPIGLPSTTPRGGEGRRVYFGNSKPSKKPAQEKEGVGGVARSIFKSAKAAFTKLKPMPKPIPAPTVLIASKICTRCGSASGASQMPGSGWIEVVLWLAYIVPGVIYSIWRRSKKYEACPACGCKDLIPMATPAGQRLVKQYHPDGVPPTVLMPTPPKPVSKITVFGVLLFVVFMLYNLGGFRS